MRGNEKFSNLILPNGTLDPAKVVERQPLYKGRNGKVIERFALDAGDGKQTFIFKPLTNADTFGREQWVYRKLLDSVPVRYPRLIASSEHDDPDRCWAIYEDMGELKHNLTDRDFITAAGAIPLWHKLPIDQLPAGFTGDKPSAADIAEEILRGERRIKSILSRLDVPEATTRSMLAAIRQTAGKFETKIVVCHGDFHQGNICVRDRECIVLDWEYVHRNSVFWDLYCLLDLSHPDYPKQMTTQTRFEALRHYLDQMEPRIERPLPFVRDYLLFSVMYSLWMLELIERDMRRGQWPIAKLLSSEQETLSTLKDCYAAYEELEPV